MFIFIIRYLFIFIIDYSLFIIQYSLLFIIIYVTGDIAALIHRSLQGAPELTGDVTVSPGSPVFELMTDGSDIYYPPNRKNKNKITNETVTDTNKDQDKNESKNEDQNEIDYNVEYVELRETNELLYPVFINEAAYNEKDIAFLLMIKIELDLQIMAI